MLDHLTGYQSEKLSADEYLSDFWPYFQKLEGVFWKLECRQSFREPRNPSWQALDRGDWHEALRIIDETSTEIQAPILDSPGFPMHRLRLVTRPYTPYLRWELHFIRLRAQAGERIRVLDTEALGQGRRPLPELVILGSSVMYEVVYDQSGTLSGARKISDPALIESCRHDVEDLFARGEDLLTFLDRDRAALPPPLSDATHESR
ncbi:DUF6879 family protein [Streptosporangium amethystogenes]|uniref:DUF6879 family protein n=1 Tax=Streptosporangium amethystogenes TaxID=2002 RepID=UPI000562A7BE|nr:DUF6879 family protein [Streptosporangium amethystogenes]